MEEVITVETVLSEIDSMDLDWAATHLDELFEAGLDIATYRRIERMIEAAE
jgi:hypothetical protein